MNVNDQIKMKVLAGLRKHLDDRMGSRLKPKKALEIDAVKVAPMDPTMKGAPDMSPGPMGAPEGKPDMSDDDTRRLMDLYGSLK